MASAFANPYELLINGQSYGGWEKISVTTSLDALAGIFEATVNDRWPGQPQQWAVQTGDAVQVLIGGVLRITGWVDEVEPKEGAEEHEIVIRGRGRCGDLVDCSAMNQPGRWTGRQLEQIVTDLCSPFSISVSAMADTGAPFAAFALQQAESVKDAIDRLCQQRGVLPMETPTGDLVIVNPGTSAADGTLTLGAVGNIKDGSAKHSAAERFSLYVVKGNRQGNDQDSGATVAQVTAQATDPAVTRYRPLMILAEDQADTGSATDRAKFAATVRAGRSQTGKLIVQGDADASGNLWSPNTLVPVNAPDLGLVDTLLIQEVKLECSDNGTTAEIHVIRPEAYSLGEVKGPSLSRLVSRHAGRGARGRGG
jgi:prophage tail gpP-like protein